MTLTACTVSLEDGVLREGRDMSYFSSVMTCLSMSDLSFKLNKHQVISIVKSMRQRTFVLFREKVRLPPLNKIHLALFVKLALCAPLS